MFAILQTIGRGLRGQAVEGLIDANAIVLLDQKVRDAEHALASGKDALATLIVRARRERSGLEGVERRNADLEARAVSALQAGHEALASDAAEAIAEGEAEIEARRRTVERLDGRVSQLRTSIDRAHRRVVALRQGAVTARSIERERAAQARFGHALDRGSDPDAEALIQRVLDGDDPFEMNAVRDEIERDLDGTGLADRLSEAGHGAPIETRGADVLARLREQTNQN